MSRRHIYLVTLVTALVAVAPGVSNGGDPTLVGWWTFDDGSGTTPADSSDYGRHGEFVGDPQWGIGNIGGALSTSAGNYVVIPGYTGILGPNPRTCTAWIKTTTADGVIIGWGLLSGGNKWIMRVNQVGGGGQLRCEVDAGYHYGTTKVNDDEWHHVAGVLEDDGSPDIAEVRLYVDGVRDADNADLADEPINTIEAMDVTIGQNPHSLGTRSYDGLLDEIRVYDRALTQAEIQAVMNQGGQGFPVARAPSPENGSLYVNTWANLTWRSGDFVISHDVYLGENFDDVTEGAEGTFVGNQATTTLIVGFPGFPIPGGLVPGTTYYWRIDEVNDADPNSPWKGDVWSFSIPPKTAYSPNPADGAEFVAPNAIFTWAGGYDSKLHTVYLGDNYDDVSNAAGGLPSGDTSYDPGTLEPEKVLYWRVDEFDGAETHKGDIWSFTTPGAVGSPQPANGAVDVQMIETLSWTPADNAASHELYFGADADAVNNASTASPEYVGPRALGAESYDPGGLAWDSSYAWRVDEVYPTGTVKGLVWTFTTADFILVDDFESYNDIDPPDSASDRIFDKWIDGFGTTTNGALVGNDLPPYAEQTNVHAGAQAMIYRYDNNLKTSEATLSPVYPRNWTEEGVAKLSLWFRGASSNAAERIFVAINGTAVVYQGDPDATQIVRWTEWIIDLQTFADQGVDLASVNTITIGFGTKNSPATGGSGTVFIDDIRLLRPAP